MILPLLLAAAFAAPPAKAPPPDPWAEVVRQATPAVVSIDILATRAFDTEGATHSFATGFVVDAARGILLTNRHVVTPGPTRSEAITHDNEVVPLRAIYRDPVHDFGFYQFDPAALTYASLPALELDSSAARVGMEIRVVGNNAGEKLSIHAGTIARLDREAPRYGRDGFNDFNTFYIQAAAGTSGGSSGSPVLDVRGKVVALNAGSRRDSSASFYLPLDRVERALALIQAGQPVTRGSIHAVFARTAWDELRRLGLQPSTESAARKRDPEATGLLVVREVLPGGPAFGKLQVGDVLVSLDGSPINTFLPLEARLDDRVKQTVTLGIERAGRPETVVVDVLDLHADTPAAYLEISGDLVHDLSYQQARNHNVPVRGVYVASSTYGLGHAGVPDGARIDSVDGKDTPDLATFEAVVAAIPDQARVSVRYIELTEPNRVQVAAWRVDRTLFPARHCVRDDASGKWPCVDLPAAPAAAVPMATAISLPPRPPGPPGKVSDALVWVEARLPFVLSGNEGDLYSGVGVVVDAAQGLVLVDRDTVPQSLADISVVVGGVVRLPARAVYFHPEHNLAVIRFDPKLLTGEPLGEARFDRRRPATGSSVWQVGLNGRLEVAWSETRVQGYRPFPLFAPSVPQYRDHDVDLLATVDAPLERGGVVIDKQGEVVAFLASFLSGSGKSQSAAFRGIPADIVADVVDALRAGTPPPSRTLGAAWTPLPLALGVDRGLSPEAAGAFAKAGLSRILTLTHLSPVGGAFGRLQEGDLLLAIEGRPTASWRDLDLAAARPSVRLTVWRGGGPVEVDVPPTETPVGGLDRAFVWAGALIQDNPSVLSLQRGLPDKGVYIAWRWFGTPADRYDLDPTWRIVGVGGTPVADLTGFMAAVAGLPDGAAVRLDLRDLDDRPRVATLKLDLDSWPAARLDRGPNGWVRTPVL